MEWFLAEVVGFRTPRKSAPVIRTRSSEGYIHFVSIAAQRRVLPSGVPRLLRNKEDRVSPRTGQSIYLLPDPSRADNLCRAWATKEDYLVNDDEDCLLRVLEQRCIAGQEPEEPVQIYPTPEPQDGVLVIPEYESCGRIQVIRWVEMLIEGRWEQVSWSEACNV